MATKKKRIRIGPRMRDAVMVVRLNPGCPILRVAEMVGPHGSRKYGYEIVHRAIAAGLIEATRDRRGVYSLNVAE